MVEVLETYSKVTNPSAWFQLVCTHPVSHVMSIVVWPPLVGLHTETISLKLKDSGGGIPEDAMLMSEAPTYCAIDVLVRAEKNVICVPPRPRQGW